MDSSLLDRHILSIRKRTDEMHASVVFHDTIKDSPWFKNQALSLGGYAIGYPCAYAIYRILNDFKPKNILEFGLGQSTIITSQYVKYYKAQLTVVEQSQEWIEFFKLNYEEFCKELNLIHCKTIKKQLPKSYRTQQRLENCSIRPFPFSKEETVQDLTYLAYEDLNIKIAEVIKRGEENKINFAIIDAPFDKTRQEKTLARRDILEITPYLSEDFIILLDDTDRYGEQQVIFDLMSRFPKKMFHVRNFWGEKCSTVIATDKYQYATTI